MSTYHTEMKVPIRPAPPPPVNQKFSNNWANIGDDKRSKSDGIVQKKKPPPRPPPPKFPNKSVPSRPSQLIAGLFHRKNITVNNAKAGDVRISNPSGDHAATDSKNSNGFLLIDFSSPPSSPTFTTRSSSDALSVNSFGSDGVTQSSGSSGNTSNIESGFEDDFEVFSNGSRKHETINQPRDPWSPPILKAPEQKKPWVAFPSPNMPKKNFVGMGAMPTIIRSKPAENKAQSKVNNCDIKSSVDLLTNVFECAHLGSSINEEKDDDGWSESPPMPTCPPPPPPVMFNDLQNVINSDMPRAQPNAIALYDYIGEQEDDLSFRKDDIIILVRRIDENWFVGEKEGLQGNVPANFITVRVPLPGDEDVFVTALYGFQPQTWEDLEFEKGAVIKVTHKINQDWLYGECNGLWGQFPANFVDRVPTGLPTRRTN